MTEHLPSLTLASNVLDTIEQFLFESGCPLTAEQRAAFDEAHARIAQQQAEARR